MAQRIIDLTEVLPEAIEVKMPDGTTHELPGDIPVPDYLEVARLVDRLQEGGEDSADTLGELYDRVIDLFRLRNPDLEDLPIGPQTLGALVVRLYTDLAEEDEGKGEAPPSRRNGSSGTRSTSRRRTTKKSASTKS